MTKEIDYFKTFCKVSKAFGTTLGKSELLSLIVASAICSMQGKAACLFLADEDQDVFIPAAQKGLSETYLHAPPIRAKQVVDGILEGGYFKVLDATTDPRLQNHEAKKSEGIASILVVPVIVSGKAIGVLSLYTADPRDFSDLEIEFLQALAEQGGLAIQRADLFDRLTRNAKLFYDLAANISSSLDIRSILHILTAEIAEAFCMKGGLIRLLNRETDTLELLASYGLSEEYLNKGPVSADKSIVDALKGETVIIEDVSTDQRLQYREETLKEGIESMLCVPIKTGEGVIGVMRLFSGQKQTFPEDMITLVEALAYQGGLAIQNASTYLKLHEDKTSLEREIWSHRTWF